MKKLLQSVLSKLGYTVRRITPFPPASPQRPVGDMQKTLEDLNARGLICNAIMDVGANDGAWSKMAKKIYPLANFCLIEPQAEMENALKDFSQIHKGSVYFLAGAGATDEKRFLTIWDDLAGSSFLPLESDALKSVGKQREIKIISIDELIRSKQFPVPELIKLDIQGYELEALKGAELLFGKTEVFILEVSFFPFEDVPGIPVFHEVVNFMHERGYVAYDFAGLSRRPLDGALGQCDICFVKEKSFLRSSNKWG